MDKTLRFKLADVTKGALRYAEVLPDGRTAQQPNAPGATIGTLYIRKSGLEAGAQPDEITITLSY